MASLITLTDHELVSLMKAGDHTAFSEIYSRYWDKLFIHALRMTREPEAAQDVIQELFINLWEKRESLDPKTNLAGYCYTTARNRVLNHIRNHKYRNDFMTELAEFLEQHQQTAAEPLQEKELAEAIEREIANLPPKMREIFELSRKQQLSYKEIAGQLDISDKTVKKQVSNALRILRLKLGNNASLLIVYYLIKK